jgi:hypothetical protein
MKRSLLAVLALMTLVSISVSRLSAEDPSPSPSPSPSPAPCNCAPIHVLEGDRATITVGYVFPPRGVTARVMVRLLDSEGNPRLQQSVDLAPGQSQSFSVPGRDGLVRGEVVPLLGPDDLWLETAVQVFHADLDLTKNPYGPLVICSGPPVRPRPDP